MRRFIMGGATGTVLLVSTDCDRSAQIAAPLREYGYTVDMVAGGAAQGALRAGGVDGVILDVQIGRQIQASFLPETLPKPAGWEIEARFQPARQVAGDWYDAFPLTHGRIGLVIADVCDKGVGAALFMALMRSLIRAYGQQNYALRLLDVLETGAPTAPRGERGRRTAPSVGVSALRNAVELT